MRTVHVTKGRSQRGVQHLRLLLKFRYFAEIYRIRFSPTPLSGFPGLQVLVSELKNGYDEMLEVHSSQHRISVGIGYWYQVHYCCSRYAATVVKLAAGTRLRTRPQAVR